MKRFRSLAVVMALAVGISLLPLGSNPAFAACQVSPRQAVFKLIPGQIVTIDNLFVASPSCLLVGPVEVISEKGLDFFDRVSFPYGAGYVAVRVPNLSAALSIPLKLSVSASGGGTMFLRINGGALVGATIEVVSPNTTQASATTTTTTTTLATAPVSPLPAPVVVPPAPAPVAPAPVTVAPVTPTVPPPAPVVGNRPPVALGKSIVTSKGTAVAATLKGTDPEGSPLVYSVVDFPENGALTGRAPNLSYMPGDGFTGTDAFTFTVSDGVSTSETVSVSITVTSTRTVPATRTVARRAVKKKTTKK